jgi:2',3'-cyclic-nucleotide 2'-phosphodiesterase (5'-nucleotidase family)
MFPSGSKTLSAPSDNIRYFKVQQERHHIRLLFTGNTVGYIDPCDCGGGLLGGLDRRSAAIKEMRDHDRPAVLFDLGNLFEEPPGGEFTPLWRRQMMFLSREMERMGYAFVALGVADLSLGSEVLSEFLPRLDHPPLLTNQAPGALEGLETVPRVRVVAGGLTLDFFNVVDPGITGQQGLLSPWRTVLRDALHESQHGDDPADLQIVTAHVPWAVSESMPDEFREIDVIFNGTWRVPRQGTRIGNSISMTAQWSGQSLAVLDLTSRILPYQRERSSAILGFRGHHMRLLPSSDSDPEVYRRISDLIEELRRDNLIPP